MPIFDRDQLPTDPLYGTRPEVKQEEPPPFSDVLAASFRTENTLGSFFSGTSVRSKHNPDFDRFDDIKGYELYAEKFVEANTEEEVNLIKKQIDKEQRDKDIIAASGATGVMSTLAAGVLDPINLLPVGGVAFRTYRSGGSILKGAANTAWAGAVGASLSETALHATQETRTMGESVANIAGATLLAGSLGGAVTLVKKNQLNKLAKSVEDDMVIPPEDLPDYAEPNSIVITERSAGAAQVKKTTLEEETLVSALGAEKAAALIKLNPKIRLSTSPFVEFRRFIQEIAETPFLYNKNKKGIANPVALESIIDLNNARIGRAVEGQNKLYNDYKKRIGKEGGTKISFLQFREEVGRAMVRGDKHEIPEVQSTAKIYRDEVFNPLKEAAIKLEFFPKDINVKTADSYLHRWWNKEAIRANREQLKTIIHNGLRTLPDLKTPDGGDISDYELSDIADDIIERLLGGNDVRLPYDLPLAERGPLKDRTLNFIKDIDVEQFLVKDVEAVANKYLRTMGPDIAIKDWFGELDPLGEKGNVLYNMIEEKKTLMAQAKTAKERAELDARFRRDLNDAKAVFEQLRGTYGIPEDPDSIIIRTSRSLREFNYITKLGGMTISAFPDVARPVMVHGLQRVFGDGLKPLISSFKTFKLAAKEVKEAGVGWDITTDSRALSMAEVNNPYIYGTKFEKGLNSLSNSFSRVSLMTQWNAALKQFSGVVTQARILNSVEKLVKGKLNQKDTTYLLKVGINADIAQRIAKELSTYGSTLDGVKIANTKLWKDVQAQQTYRAAIKKEVDAIIVTPGIGDLPLWMKGSETGKLIGQFKSFSIGATNKILIAGLQEKDAQFVNGVVLSVALGMVAYYLKTASRGGELSDDPRVWLQEGVDRSGVLTVLGEINQISNRVTGGRISLQALAGLPPLTRYANTNALGALLGPSAGTVQDLISMTASAGGEWTESDTRAARRLIPYQNLFYTRSLFDKMEESINDSVGAQ